MIVVLLGTEIDAVLEPGTRRQRPLWDAGTEPVAFG